MEQYSLQQRITENPDSKLRDVVTDMLYEAIISLKIAPGTKLNVNQLALSLGISRTPVAEAITNLTNRGFIVSRPGHNGSYVLDLNLVDMTNLYRVRSAIESEAAALCAYTAGDSIIRELSLLADAFKESVINRDIQGMKDTDLPFHKLIVASCDNPYVRQSYEVILPKLTMYQSSMLNFIANSDSTTNPWIPKVTFNHHSVVSAIRMRMPELARQAMMDHVDCSLSFTTTSVQSPDAFKLAYK